MQVWCSGMGCETLLQQGCGVRVRAVCSGTFSIARSCLELHEDTLRGQGGEFCTSWTVQNTACRSAEACTCSWRSTPFLPRAKEISRSFLFTISYVISLGSMVSSLSRFFSPRDLIFSKPSSASPPTAPDLRRQLRSGSYSGTGNTKQGQSDLES